MIRSGRVSTFSRSLSLSAIRTSTSLTSRHALGPQASRNLEAYKPIALELARYRPLSTSVKCLANRYDKIDRKHEEQVEQEKLHAHPDQVSSTSSVHQVFHEQGAPDPEKDVDMLAGIKSDWVS